MLLSNGELRNFSKYKKASGKFNLFPLSLEMELEFPEIIFSCNYKFEKFELIKIIRPEGEGLLQ